MLRDWTWKLSDGALRDIRWRGHEVLRGIYAAVRDQDWRTIPAQVHVLTEGYEADAWVQRFECVHLFGSIDFRWRGQIRFEPTQLRFSFEGEAHSEFLANRVGFCVLHPLEVAGHPCRLTHTDGRIVDARFPDRISPHQPFLDLAGIAHEVTPGLWVEASFEGDTFETEDQRNWTDASFKTYCTPLARPFPRRMQPRDQVRQEISLSVLGNTATLPSGSPIRLELGDVLGPRPKIGTELTPGAPPTAPVDFVRVSPAGIVEARALGLPAEIACILTPGSEAAQLTELLPGPDDWVLLTHAASKTTPSSWIDQAPRCTLYAGTDYDFVEINRACPSMDRLGGLCFSINPQVHAFDDRSLFETLVAQRSVVQTARELSAGKPIAVSTVTFRRRSNPDATSGAGPSLADRVDPRQASDLGAAWTVGCLQALSESGASSVTMFESGGPLGIAGTPIEPVLARYLQQPQARIRELRSSNPYSAGGWAVESGSGIVGMLANFTPDPLEVHGPTGPLVLGPYQVIPFEL